jgi:hypothetical protein
MGLDIGGMFVWDDYLWEQDQVVDLFLGVDDGIDWGPDRLSKLQAWFWTQKPEDQKIIWPELDQAILKATDNNPLKYLPIAHGFLDPTGETAKFETTMSGTAWGLTLAYPVTQLAKFAKAFTAVQRTAKLQDKTKAAKLNDEILSDATETVAAAVGMPRTTAAHNAHPVNVGHVIPESTDDLAGNVQEVAERIAAEQAKVKAATAPMKQSNMWTRVRLLTEDEQAAYAKATESRYEKIYDAQYKRYGWTLDEAKVVNQTDEGFQIEFRVRDDRGVEQTHQTTKLDYTVDGILAETGIPKATGAGSYFFSPSVWLGAAFKAGVVDQSTIVGMQSSRIGRVFSKAQQAVWKGVSRKEEARISNVLDAGADYVHAVDGEPSTIGKIFTWDELDAVETIGKDGKPLVISLTESEKLAYYRARELFDQNYVQMNKVVRDSLVLNGYQETLINGQSFIIKAPLSRQGAGITFDKDGYFNVYDPMEGGMVKLTSKEVDDFYSRGGRVATTHDSNHIPVEGLGFVTKVLTRDTKISDLRRNVVKYNQGYVPRIYKDAPYVVQRSSTQIVDGAAIVSTVPVRRFRTRGDAQEWVRRQETDAKNPAPPGTYEASHIREVGEKVRADMVIEEAGGLFIDDKGAHLAFGLEKGGKTPVVRASDALGRQLDYIARRLPMSEFRASMIARWEAMAAQAFTGKDARLLKEQGFNVNLGSVKDPALRQALTKSRSWIRDQLMIPTWEEQRFQRMMVHIADWSEGKPILGKAAGAVGRWGFDKDPAGMAKTIGFHGMLGMFNPSQFVVQAQGATMALAVDNPLKFPMRLAQYFALRASQNINGEMPGVLSRAIAKFGGWSDEEYKLIRQQMGQSGIMDSVMTTGDYHQMRMGMPMTQSMWSRVLDAGLIPYREGESFVRGYAFLVARDRWLKAAGKPSMHKMTDTELQEVAAMTFRISLNMMRANRAAWQKGVVGIPTQFSQVMAKFTEDVILGVGGKGDKFKLTKTERARMLGGQVLLYGVGGVPAGTYLFNKMSEWVGIDAADMTKDQKENIENGFMGALSHAISGETVEIGARGAFASGWEMWYEKIIEDGLTRDVLSGASGNIIGRGVDVGLSVLTPLLRPLYNWEEEYDGDEILRGFLGMTKAFNSLNNLTRGLYWWKANAILNKDGTPILEDPENMKSIAILKMLSLGSSTEADVYEMFNSQRERDSAKRDVIKAGKDIINGYLNSGARGQLTAKQSRNVQLQLDILLAPWLPDEQIKMRETMLKPIYDPGEALGDKVINKAWNHSLNGGRALDPLNTLGQNAPDEETN